MASFKKLLYVFSIFIILSASAFALNVEFLTADFQAGAGESANISVLITHDNGTPVNNALVNFTTDLGILVPSSAHTNSSGVAELSINSTVAGIAHINASSGAAYDLTNVTFLPLAPASLLADADSPVNVAGQITNITFTPIDIYGNINSSEQVYLDVVLTDRSGNVAQYNNLSVHTDNTTLLEISRDAENDINWTISQLPFSSGSGSSFFSLNSTIAGNITITSAAGSATNITELVFLPAEPAGMGAVFNDEYTVNTSSSIYIRIYDVYDNRVPNTNLTFSVTSPENTVRNSPVVYNSASLSSYSGTTDLNGQLYNVFRTDKRAGDNVITVSVVNSSLQGNITIRGIADEIDNLYLSYSPSSAISNNKDFYTLSARPVDQFLNPILPLTTPIKEMVRFTTESGNLVLVPLNSQGQANTKVGPTPYVESLLVSATYRDASGYTNFTNSTTLYFVAGPLYVMDLYSVPNAVLSQDLNGNHDASVSLVALDEWGHTLPNVEVTFNNTNTTVGTLSVNGVNVTGPVNATTDANGRISALFTGNVSGNATIVATSGSINASTDISVKSEPFLSVDLSVSPKNVTSGGIVDIRTIISIEGELPIIRPAASAMLVLDRSGSMDPDYYAGSPLDVVLVIDRSGSMGPRHYNAMLDAKEAAKKFASNLVSNSQLGVVSFAWDPYVASSVDLELTPLNSSENLLLVNAAIDKLHAVGGTAMGEGMADANDILINDGRPDSRKVMIILTDGETNSGDDQDGSNAVGLANANGITIYTIGLGSDINEALLRSIASDTGGKYYSAPSSSDLVSIYNAIAQDISDYDVTNIEYAEEGFTPYSYTFSDSISIEDTYTLSFDGYDLDDVFDASPYYGDTSAGECLIKVNGNNLGLLPVVRTTSNSNNWKSFSYNITDYVHSGENSLSFYDYYDYTGYKDYYNYYGYSYWWSSGIGNNRVRNVVVKHNGNTIQSYSTSTNLNGNGYILSFDTPLSTDYFEDTFEINESIDDLKVELQWEHEYANLDLQLESPSGRVYGIGYDTKGYYPGSDGISEYIWIHPLSGIYEDDADAIETGIWTVRVTGISNGGTGTWQENFNISTYIDRKSAAKLSSHAFISSFDESRGDKAGLALYSFENVVLTDSQTSYVYDNSSWVGYFTVPSTGRYTFNVSWEDSSSIDVYLFDGIDLLDSSSGINSCGVSAVLYPEQTYRLDVVKGASSNTDTRFSVNVSVSSLDKIMTAYYDAGGGGGTPKFRTYDGSLWSLEGSANYVGGNPYFVVMDSSPVRSEIIMLTGDGQNDVNAQIWDGSSWGSISELSTELNQNSRRGFDVKYEQISGDAIAVYMNRNINSGRVPRYQIWDGSSWSAAASVDGTDAGTGRVEWLKLASDPNSDNMTLVTQDDAGRIRAQVWNGNSWGNSVVITNAANGAYQSFDVIYDGNGRVMVVWADWSVSSSGFWFWTTYTCNVRTGYHIFNGGSWSPGSMAPFSYSSTGFSNPYSSYSLWVKAAADPGSNNALIALQDAYRIRAASWNGASWSAFSELQSSVQYPSVRSVDVAFEHVSGNGMVAWGGDSNDPQYRIWYGSSWSTTDYAFNVGAYPRSVKLVPDSVSNDIFLMTSDNSYDLNIQKWSGSSWGSVTEVETSSSRDFECFDIVFSTQSGSSQSTPVSWNQWTASVTSSLQNDSVSHLSNSIDTITADGLTAIDEGLFVANNELSSVDGESTIVLMTDGIDNAGYHSMLEEAYRAKTNNTTIYTVGFGNTESEVDPILAEIASITGGQYYFAPNSSALEDIFKGIAMQITNFSAGGPELNLHVPYNYVSPLSVAKVTYVTGSSNATTGNLSVFNIPGSPGIGNAEPVISTSGTKSILEWKLPTLGPGDKWGIWYQMKVDGAGYVPIIMPTSTVTYTDLSGENITVNVGGGGAASVGGFGGGLSSFPLAYLDIVPDSNVINISETTTLTLTVTDINGDPAFVILLLNSSIGSFNETHIYNVTESSVNFTSAIAGKAYITATALHQNNITDRLVASDVLYVRPKGRITIS
ncbi:VWA domain-containing protein [Methanolobus sp. WCC5]|uniref:VWA domain-containing protein n=1 Tax=Methanolobus sp. WCC5 TaxID=3125785 RepID=UPI0032482D69